MNFLGGSLFQVIIPLATVVVFARSSLKSLPFTLYWTGQSMVNVSIYISDAPYQRLHLIARGLIHDWRWLLTHSNLMEYAEDIGTIVNVLGIITCLAGIGMGFYFAFNSFRQSFTPHSHILP